MLCVFPGAMKALSQGGAGKDKESAKRKRRALDSGALQAELCPDHFRQPGTSHPQIFARGVEAFTLFYIQQHHEIGKTYNFSCSTLPCFFWI